MAFDDVLAERVRERLSDLADADERKMFGGLAFMVNTHMACGIIRDDLMVRVGVDRYDEALEHGARPMDFTGRPMRGLVIVDGEALDDDVLDRWIDLAVTVARAEAPRRKRPRPSGP